MVETMKDLTKAMADLYRTVSGQPDKTDEELLERCKEGFAQSCRNAEVEEILAWNAECGVPIPGDVTDIEIKAAQMRYKNNTIFRLADNSYYYAGERHGQSFTEACREAVIRKAKSQWRKPLERDLDALSGSARLNKILENVR